jgi:wobble nucleotide-excising tRNase
MIKKISKIKNLGVFKNYSIGSIPEFKRYNVIYGWNGSGKTTLSKLFSGVNLGLILEYPDLEYEISSDSVTFKHGNQYPTKIRVFNKKYVEDNIELLNAKAKSIFILGAKNKEISEQIKQDEKKLEQLKIEKNKLEIEKDKKEKGKDQKFTDVAKIIGATLSGSTVRNYQRPQAKSDFDLLKTKETLEDAKLVEFQTILKQEEKPRIVELSYSLDLEECYKQTISLCSSVVKSNVIKHLKDHEDISNWVESGLKLYQLHQNKKCEFCDNSFSKERLQDLLAHFNKEDQALKEQIQKVINDLEQKKDQLNILKAPEKALLYKELHTEYVSRITTFSQEKINLLLEITTLIQELNNKKNKTTEKISFVRTLNNSFLNSLSLLNQTIEKHNKKTENFQIQKDEVNLKLKKHYLSEIFDEIKQIDKDVKEYTTNILSIQNGTPNSTGIKGLQELINKNKAIISSEHKACEELNKKLEIFLGRDEIKFEVAPEGGYIIKRNNKTAGNLSEGEKTAISFIYFIVHLEDQNFNLKDGIIVIDDPVSSLDSNSLFQAFSFLKNSVKDAKQVFLFTHNFDFLKLLLNWLNHFPEARNNKSYFMIKNSILTDEERNADLVELDKLLQEYDSEYHYLCKRMFEYKSDGTIETAYQITNITRKVLETFLMFVVPTNENMYQKMEAIDFDKVKKDAIYKFTNDQSHKTGSGFDPSLVQEAQKNIKHLLEMMKKVFPSHYQSLEDQFINKKS